MSNPSRTIRKEEPVQAGPLKIDYKLFWLVLTVALCLVVWTLASKADVGMLGMAFTVIALLGYIAFVVVTPFDRLRTSALTLLYRRSRRTTRNIKGQNVFVTDLPEIGQSFGMEETAETRRENKLYFPPVGKITFFPYPTGIDDQGKPLEPLGIIQDRRKHTRSVVLWTVGSSLLGSATADHERRQDAFSRVQQVCLELGTVYRIGWRVQTFIGEPQNPEATVALLRAGANLPPSTSPPSDVFTSNLIKMGEDSVVHRTTMVFTIDTHAVKQQAKAHGGSSEAVLVGMLGAIQAAVMGADGEKSPLGLRAASFLTYNDLIMETRLALDPVHAQPLWEGWAGLQDPTQLLRPSFAWPGYADFRTSPDWGRAGETYHVGRYFDTYNPLGVFPDQVGTIAEVRVPKTMTTIVQLVPTQQAHRRAEWAKTSLRSTNRGSSSVTELRDIEEGRATSHAREVAEGNSIGRVRTYIDVTAASISEALENARLVDTVATGTQSVIFPMTAKHDLSVQAAMPAGRGLAAVKYPTWL
jgi:hypothetical protein